MKIPSVLRALRIGLLILTTLTTLVILFYTEENWRGRHAWEVEKSQLLASGLSLDPALLAVRSIPMERNFMAAEPLISLAKEDAPGQARLWRSAFCGPAASIAALSFNNAWEKVFFGLHSAAQALADRGGIRGSSDRAAVEEALRRLAQMRPSPRSIRALARARDQSQFLSAGIDVNFGHLFALSQATAGEAELELAAGNPAEALGDARILMRLIQADESGRTMLSGLIGLAEEGELIRVFSAGERMGSWTDDQLREFARFFGDLDEAALMEQALRFTEVRRFTTPLDRSAFGPQRGWNRFQPTGWLIAGAVGTDRDYRDTLSDFDHNGHRFDLAQAQEQLEAARQEHRPHTVGSLAAAALSQPPVGAVGTIVAALELYRRAQGAFPSRLEDLVPRYLPRLPASAITGQPPVYAAPDRDHFRLSSAGWRPGAKPPEWAWNP
ncbi:MAG TPA: hypothetical protein VHC86_09470 [Opitutaceae bacterium]|nr:hypothetical protein [Opitutaceae bacterium]